MKKLTALQQSIERKKERLDIILDVMYVTYGDKQTEVNVLTREIIEDEKLLDQERQDLIKARRNGRVNTNQILKQDDAKWFSETFKTL